MKCVAKTKRKYYKYQYLDWEQPIFSNDYVWGRLECSSYNSSYYAWRALDGVFPNTSGNYGNTWETGNSATGWWKWKFDRPLQVRSIKVYPRATSSGATIGVGVRYDLYTYTQSELLGSQAVLANQYPTDYAFFEFDEPMVLDGIYIYKDSSGDNYCGIGELVLDASLQVSVESTIDDYDYYVDCKDYEIYPELNHKDGLDYEANEKEIINYYGVRNGN